MPRSLTLLLSLCLMTAVLDHSADAQNRRRRNLRRVAYNSVATAHPDFALQGEFQGEVFDGNRRVRLGLQVSAVGDGKFDAVGFLGGLPGSRSVATTRDKMSGTRSGDRVVLKGPAYHFVVEPEAASVYDTLGRPLGQITKVLRVSPTLGQRPPAGATILFNGTHTRHFKNGRIAAGGLLKEGTETRKAYRDFTMHLEFRLPFMPYARGQGRANSGVYLQGRYEVQILDSFTLDGKHNECGGLYKFREPDINMCLPPLSWQTYDIDFTAARFENGVKVQNAKLTVWHNGVLIHNGVELLNKTGAGAKEGPQARPTKLQNHSNPVRFRNIWIVERDKPVIIPSPQLRETPRAW